MGPSYGADAAAKVPYSGPGPGIWDLNLVGPDQKARKNVVLNFAMSFCISLASLLPVDVRQGVPVGVSGNFDIKLPRHACARPIDSISPDPDLE